MSDFTVLCVNTFAAFIGVIPFLIILQIFCRKYKLPKRHQLGLYLYALSICTIIMASGTPSLYEIEFYPALNLIPFYGISDNFLQYIQAFLIFVPFGLLLPTLWKQFQTTKAIIVCGFFFALLIELSQLFSFSTTDVNELIMSTLGTITGYFFFLQIKDLSFMGRMCLDSNDTERSNLSQWEVYIYFFTSWLVTFILTPFISNGLWSFLWESLIGVPL